MIHVVNQSNRHLYARQMWDMYVARSHASPGPDGGDDLMVFDAAEADDLDDERAIYLLALDEHGRLEGAIRFRPTDDKSILFDRRPHLLAPDEAGLKGPETWEGVRVFTTPAFRRSCRRGHRGFPGLELAGREAALDRGARYAIGARLGACVEVSAASNARGLESLGEPIRLSYEVNDEDLEVFGSILAAQNMVEAARWASNDPSVLDVEEPAIAIARAKALFARLDLMAAGELQRWAGA
jgi:hypothetical protein